jgi:hypothetical protein
MFYLLSNPPFSVPGNSTAQIGSAFHYQFFSFNNGQNSIGVSKKVSYNNVAHFWLLEILQRKLEVLSTL